MIEVTLAIVQCWRHRFLGTGRINREDVFGAGIRRVHDGVRLA